MEHEQADWATRVGRTIAEELRRHRRRRGWSAQQLSDECGRLGEPIPRNVISNIENARKLNVSVAEILTLAAALRVPPAALIFPAGYVDEVEYLPGRRSDPLRAIDWLAGEKRPAHEPRTKGFPFDGPESDAWAITYVREHRQLVTRIRDLRRSAWEEAKTFQPPMLTEEIEAARELAELLEANLIALRREMVRLGYRLPELPPGMQEPSSSQASGEDQPERS